MTLEEVNRLESLSNEDKRERIGEYIYNRAKDIFGDQAAARIAGMLLEFEFKDLQPLLTNHYNLDQNIRAAHQMMQTSQQSQ